MGAHPLPAADQMAPSQHPDTSPAYSSKYRVIRDDDGFHVEGTDRHPVYVRLSPQRTAILVGSQHDQEVYNTYHLFAFRAQLAGIVDLLMQDWTRPDDHPNDWSGVGTWAVAQTGRMLNHRIHPQWQRLLSLVPETERAVERAVFAATFASTHFGCEAWPELFEFPFLAQDVIGYRAAAVACHYALSMVQSLAPYADANPHCFSEEWRAFLIRYFLVPFAHSAGGEYSFFDVTCSDHRRELLTFLARDWKALYTHRGKPSGSLRRTLMQCPGNIPASLLHQLHVVEPLLQRPLTDRVELLLLFVYGRNNRAASQWEYPFFAKATRKDIRSALRLLSSHLRRELRPTTESLTQLVAYIHDYCRYCDREQLPMHSPQGNIVGLLSKSIIWHREMREQELARLLTTYRGDEPTGLPPVPLPDHRAITFLATVRDIYQEGLSMGHCIASYTEGALSGADYLFHVSYQGDEASVQVSCAGDVYQSFGPHNNTNAASRYGMRVLTKWGKQLKAFAREPESPLYLLAPPVGALLDHGEFAGQPF